MVRKIMSVLAGVIAGGLAVALLQMINLNIYPAPLDLDTTDMAQMREYVKSLPRNAFILVIISHFVGALVAGLVAGMVAKNGRMKTGLIAAAIILAFTVVNYVNIPHPNWVIGVDSIATIIGGLLGSRIGANRVVG